MTIFIKYLLKYFYRILIFIIPKPVNGLSLKEIYKTFQPFEYHLFSFHCTQCGKCCFGPGNVYFTKKDLNKIRKYLKINFIKWQIILKQIIKKHVNGLYVHHSYERCYFLNENHQCSIYPVRPLQCRTFPFWPSNFSNSEKLKNLINDCPGSKLISPVEFKKQSNKSLFSIFFLEQIVFHCNSTIKKFNCLQIHKKMLIKL